MLLCTDATSRVKQCCYADCGTSPSRDHHGHVVDKAWPNPWLLQSYYSKNGLLDRYNSTQQMAHLMQREQQRQPFKNKKRLNEEQVKLLEKSFSMEKKLEPQIKVQLALDLGLQPRQVAIWYQNKRARCKTQQLELEHKALKSQFESVIVEKKKLEREVTRLRQELKNKKGEVGVCDGEGSGSGCLFVEEENEIEEVLYMEDLYACFMGFQGQHGKLFSS